MSFEFENVGLLQLQPTFTIIPKYSNSSTFGTLIEKLVPFLVFPDCEHCLCPSLYNYYSYSPVDDC